MTLNQSSPTPDATTTSKGKIQLANALAGTAASPTLNTNAVTTTSITNASVTANKLSTGAAYGHADAAETTTSTTYVQLTTKTDTVTVTVGANGLALVIYGCDIANSVAGQQSIVAVAMTGATTETAGTNANRTMPFDAPNNGFGHGSEGYLATGLTPGSTTFTLWYKVTANTGTFQSRHISVVPL